MPLTHRSQVGWGLLAGPLGLLICCNFCFNFHSSPLYCSHVGASCTLAALGKQAVFPSVSLVPCYCARAHTHTYTRQFHTCGVAGHPRSSGSPGPPLVSPIPPSEHQHPSWSSCWHPVLLTFHPWPPAAD